jgi:hypothetical protein
MLLYRKDTTLYFPSVPSRDAAQWPRYGVADLTVERYWSTLLIMYFLEILAHRRSFQHRNLVPLPISAVFTLFSILYHRRGIELDLAIPGIVQAP